MGNQKYRIKFDPENDQRKNESYSAHHQFIVAQKNRYQESLYKRILCKSSGFIIVLQAAVFIAAGNDAQAQGTDSQPAPAAASAAPADRFKATVNFNIPASTLFDALQTLSLQSGIPITLLP
ncbi:MAG: hypothetical protein VB101_13085, partial [Rhodospirillaceae bacterium]|nr:hypothetical protein [Rhodospirillaceae bacterium]